MTYRLYTGKQSRHNRVVWATITKDHHIAFNKTAVERYKLFPGETIRLFFDRENGLLGVELYHKDGVEKVLKIDNLNRASIKGIAREFRLKIDNIYGRHPVYCETDSGIITVDLKRKL